MKSETKEFIRLNREFFVCMIIFGCAISLAINAFMSEGKLDKLISAGTSLLILFFLFGYVLGLPTDKRKGFWVKPEQQSATNVKQEDKP